MASELNGLLGFALTLMSCGPMSVDEGPAAPLPCDVAEAAPHEGASRISSSRSVFSTRASLHPLSAVTVADTIGLLESSTVGELRSLVVVGLGDEGTVGVETTTVGFGVGLDVRSFAVPDHADELWLGLRDRRIVRLGRPGFEEQLSVPVAEDAPWALAVDREGTMLAWADSRTVGVIDREGTTLAQWSVRNREHSLAFVGSRQWLAFIDDEPAETSHLWIWSEDLVEPRRIRALHTLSNDPGFACAGDWIYFHDAEGAVVAHNIQTTESLTIDPRGREVAARLVVSSDERYLAEGGYSAANPAAPLPIRIYDLHSGESVDGPESRPLAFDPASNVLLTGGLEAGLELIEPSSGQLFDSLVPVSGESVTEAVFSCDGTRLATASLYEGRFHDVNVHQL